MVCNCPTAVLSLSINTEPWIWREKKIQNHSKESGDSLMREGCVRPCTSPRPWYTKQNGSFKQWSGVGVLFSDSHPLVWDIKSARGALKSCRCEVLIENNKNTDVVAYLVKHIHYQVPRTRIQIPGVQVPCCHLLGESFTNSEAVPQVSPFLSPCPSQFLSYHIK